MTRPLTCAAVVVFVSAGWAPASAQDETCRLIRERRNGANRDCVYQCRTGESTLTVRSYESCSQTLVMGNQRDRYRFTSPGAEAAKAIEEHRAKRAAEREDALDRQAVRRSLDAATERDRLAAAQLQSGQAGPEPTGMDPATAALYQYAQNIDSAVNRLIEKVLELSSRIAALEAELAK